MAGFSGMLTDLKNGPYKERKTIDTVCRRFPTIFNHRSPGTQEKGGLRAAGLTKKGLRVPP